MLTRRFPDKTFSLHRKSHQNLTLLKCTARVDPPQKLVYIGVFEFSYKIKTWFAFVLIANYKCISFLDRISIKAWLDIIRFVVVIWSIRFRVRKQSTNLMLMRNDCKFRDYSALYVTCFKIDMTKRISDHQFDSLLPTYWKTISLTSAKTLLISHYKWNIWSLCRKNHSIACSSSSGHLGVKQPIFARLTDILSLPERIVAWSRLQRRTMDSLSP